MKISIQEFVYDTVELSQYIIYFILNVDGPTTRIFQIFIVKKPLVIRSLIFEGITSTII